MPEMTPHARAIFERVRALRQLTLSSGMRTTRSQNVLLATLSDLDFAEVVFQLQEDEKRRNVSNPITISR
jgi:hypothetical protein